MKLKISAYFLMFFLSSQSIFSGIKDDVKKRLKKIIHSILPQEKQKKKSLIQKDVCENDTKFLHLIMRYFQDDAFGEIEAILKNKTSVSHQEFIHAIIFGDTRLVSLFLKYKTDVNSIDCKFKKTPLMCAARYLKIDLIKLLIESGAEINSKDSDERSALAYLIERLMQLIDKADISERYLDLNDERSKLIPIAQAIRLLLFHGADTTIKIKAIDKEPQPLQELSLQELSLEEISLEEISLQELAFAIELKYAKSFKLDFIQLLTKPVTKKDIELEEPLVIQALCERNGLPSVISREVQHVDFPPELANCIAKYRKKYIEREYLSISGIGELQTIISDID